MTHWANAYIGLDYTAVGRCWGLVQQLMFIRHKILAPDLPLNNEFSQETYRKLKETIVDGEWFKVKGEPAEDDVVLMDGLEGPHVGYAIFADGIPHIIHAVPHAGQVICSSMDHLRQIGYKNIEIWRRNRVVD